MTFPTAPSVALLLRPRPSPYQDPTMTVGKLAELVRRTAAHAEKWWHLVRFEEVEVPLDQTGCGMWLTVWPPGHGTGPRESVGTEEVFVVLAGELTETTGTTCRVIRQEVPAHRVHVHGTGAGPRELRNRSPFYAISLHARAGS